MKRNFFATTLGIISVGVVIGVLAPLLQKFGNPGNMGICVACFLRDIAGSLGLHRAAVVQYLRPEIPSFVLGSFLAAMLFKEFRPRGGSAPIIRFFLGFFAMIGALVFLGCPWRTILRLAGGDLNAIFGLIGLVTGISIGIFFFKQGFDLGRTQRLGWGAGLVFPVVMAGLLLLRLVFPPIPGEPKSGVLFYSIKGPGTMFAPVFISIGAGLLIGILAQRSRFCTMGAFRDLILFRQGHLFFGVLAFFSTALLMNLILGQFYPGFTGQPAAHTQAFWNFAGMVLAGLAFALAGGCPGRQLFLSGEGDTDAAIFALGMLIGAAFAHNFAMAATPKGISPHSMAGVIIGLIFCVAVGLIMRRK
ncbi:YedE family putative selenium transporter [Thermodesulfatator indicus]